MAVDRPTFSESWYRVAELRPRLRSTVQVHRQHYRGRMWHVLQDPASNQFFRLNEAAYRFTALLDGRRTVGQAWRLCADQLGDDAPTQGEAIQLLGQLYASNLLAAELPPDAERLFRRYRRRRQREVRGYLSNLLFIRVPLIDPDHFLDRWVGVFGRLFTWPMLIGWLALMAVGGYHLVGRVGELADRATGVLDVDNLGWLYLSMILVKVFHEFGHGFACKRFGRRSGTGGEVHVMGVMFLVFTPVPYVDASSAWALRSKWHRVVVGAAGMMVELAVAAVAAIVWAHTAQGAVAHKVAYNIIFIAGVSTLLFNGNPLLRYDGYYILSDLLEMPNLAQRSREYLYYLVKRYAWSVRAARSPAHTPGERAWLLFYAIASTLYRVVICIGILLFVADKLFFVGAVLAVAAAVAWVGVPLGRFAHYLASSPELSRVRGRAVGSTLGGVVAIAVGIGRIPAPDRCRAEGVVEPVRLAIVYAGADGFVGDVTPSGRWTQPGGSPLVTAANPELEAQLQQLRADRRRLEARRRLALTQELAAAQIVDERIAAVDERITRVRRDLAALAVAAPFAGEWISPEVDRLRGAYVRRGDSIGMVAAPEELLIRAPAGQQIAEMILAEADRDRVEIRVKGRPAQRYTGSIREILPAGSDQLPSDALSYTAGGSIETTPDERRGLRATERLFEVRVVPHLDPDDAVPLLSGQRVVVRFEMPPRPLAVQWWRSLLQLVQRRFHI